MPLYEFICEECDYTEEVLQRYDDPPPVCKNHQKEMVRQISLTKTRKGAGIYSLDFDRKLLGQFEHRPKGGSK